MVSGFDGPTLGDQPACRTSPTLPAVSVVAGSGPVRTCLGCREKGRRADLVRLVVDGENRVILDENRSAPGRGGWLHPRRTCWELARRRNAVPRALRVPGGVDVTRVAAWFAGRDDAD